MALRRIEVVAPETMDDVRAGVEGSDGYVCGCVRNDFEIYLCGYHEGFDAAYRRVAVEFAADGGAEYLIRRVRDHRDGIRPPYLFPLNESALMPGMATVTVNDAIRDIWSAAHDSIMEVLRSPGDGRAAA